MTSKDANKKDKAVSTKPETKKKLKGGDPNDVNPSNSSLLIEQAFFLQ